MTGILNILAGSISSAIKDGYFNLVSLLLPGNGTNGAQNNTFLDSSSNAFSITRNGNTTQGTFSPFSQTGWSVYFDGDNDYFTFSANTAFDLTQGDFTVEAFVNVGAGGNIFGYRLDSPSSAGWEFRVNASTGFLDFFYTGGSSVSTTTAFPLNRWVHVAACRSGSTCRLFVDGVQQAINSSFSNGVTASTTLYVGVTYDISTDFKGYISNARITKGGALYTSAFTPSTAPLTTTVAAGTVSLLICQDNRFRDASSNAFTLTVNGTPSVQAFSPFAPTAAYSAATNGGSGYFDGTGDYLTTPTGQTALTLGTNNFTVEMWFYPRTQVQTAPALFSSTPLLAMTNGILLQGTSSNNKLELWVNNTNLTASSTNNYMVLNQWNHVAVCRTGGNTYVFYINGVAVNNVATNTTSLTANSWLVGYWTVSGNEFTGYISGFRILNGTALYSGATITIPTAPLTNITNTSLLLNYTNAGITDATAKNVLETVGNAQISTTRSKFGGSSMYFDGTGDYLKIPSTAITGIGTGDFTIEFWIYRVGSGTQIIFDQRSAATQVALCIFNDSSNNLQLYINGANRISAGALSANTWVHVAVCRSGTSTKMFVNGTQGGSTYTDSNNYLNNPIFIGIQFDATSGVNGYIDDFRLSNYARYTANFTAPTAAFPVQ